MVKSLARALFWDADGWFLVSSQAERVREEASSLGTLLRVLFPFKRSPLSLPRVILITSQRPPSPNTTTFWGRGGFQHMNFNIKSLWYTSNYTPNPISGLPSKKTDTGKATFKKYGRIEYDKPSNNMLYKESCNIFYWSKLW